jgi:hypothetical protein
MSATGPDRDSATWVAALLAGVATLRSVLAEEFTMRSPAAIETDPPLQTTT